MSHYRNGTKAELGDLVRGTGYNIKHEVHGIVVGLTPGQGSCDIHIATLRAAQPLGTQTMPHPVLVEEHGTCAQFTLIACSPLSPGRPVPPAPAVEDLARVGFEAYTASTGGKTWDGKDVPPYDAIRESAPHVAKAWEAAAAAIRSA